MRLADAYYTEDLRSFVFEMNHDNFEKHSWFFRNALVRSQYENIPKVIHSTFEPLERFMNFAVFGIPVDLRNRTLHIRWDEAKPQSEVSKRQNDVLGTSLSVLLSLKEMAVIRQIQDNPNISITDIAANTRLSKSTIDRIIRALKEKGLLTRIGAKNNATWLINHGHES